MFDIGLGEILLLAVVGLLVFGPEKLPKAAADAGRLIRQLRSMAAGARQELAESAGLDLSEAADVVRDLSDLHPRRLAAGLLDDDDAAPESRERGSGPSSARRAAAKGETRPGGPVAANPAAVPPDASPSPTVFDPDAT